MQLNWRRLMATVLIGMVGASFSACGDDAPPAKPKDEETPKEDPKPPKTPKPPVVPEHSNPLDKEEAKIDPPEVPRSEDTRDADTDDDPEWLAALEVLVDAYEVLCAAICADDYYCVDEVSLGDTLDCMLDCRDEADYIWEEAELTEEDLLCVVALMDRDACMLAEECLEDDGLYCEEQEDAIDEHCLGTSWFDSLYE